jgi:hypothetical protein
VKTGMAEGDWEVLLSRIRNKTCTPFLGAGASAHVLPTGTELADQWAKELRYPLPERGDLAQVAQYMAITRDDPFPKERVSELCRKIHPAEALRRGDSYDIISSLDLPMYITTNYDDLLMHALQNNGKTPQALLCPWHNSLYRLAGETYTYAPTPEKPAVYYLHGSATVPRSIVITEDDYLDFIVWVTQKWKEQPDVSRIAPAVIDALGTNSLLFIGYSQKDWSFRVLMRCIRQAGNSLGARHIAVQLPLRKDATQEDQDNISEYVTRYFAKIQGNPVTIYWGTADEFLKDLQKHMGETERS